MELLEIRTGLAGKGISFGVAKSSASPSSAVIEETEFENLMKEMEDQEVGQSTIQIPDRKPRRKAATTKTLLEKQVKKQSEYNDVMSEKLQQLCSSSEEIALHQKESARYARKSYDLQKEEAKNQQQYRLDKLKAMKRNPFLLQ